MFILIIIKYEDDYKHRFDNGVYLQKPELFKTEDEAYNSIVDFINTDFLYELEGVSIEDDEIKYFDAYEKYKDYLNLVVKKKENLKYFKLKDNISYDMIKEMWNCFFEGEFVELRAEYTIYNV